jgi:hypothetical protein
LHLLSSFVLYFGTAKSIASSNRFSSLSLGYNADSAFAKRRKSRPRSCSALPTERISKAMTLDRVQGEPQHARQ